MSKLITMPGTMPDTFQLGELRQGHFITDLRFSPCLRPYEVQWLLRNEEQARIFEATSRRPQ